MAMLAKLAMNSSRSTMMSCILIPLCLQVARRRISMNVTWQSSVCVSMHFKHTSEAE